MTPKQLELLHFIKTWIECYEYPPSYNEMMVGLGFTSKSPIHRLLTGLEEQGLIRRLHNRARAIEVVENPRFPPRKASRLTLAELEVEANRRGWTLVKIAPQARNEPLLT